MPAIEVFDGFRKAYLVDRAQFFLDVASGPFFGFNRPGAKVSQGLINSWWLQGMMCGHKNGYDCIKAFSETDFTEDLKKFDVPTLIIHGDDDQIVPIGASGDALVQNRENATLKIYPGGTQAAWATQQRAAQRHLLAFSSQAAAAPCPRIQARDGMRRAHSKRHYRVQGVLEPSTRWSPERAARNARRGLERRWTRIGYAVLRPLLPLVRAIAPGAVISTEELGRAVAVRQACAQAGAGGQRPARARGACQPRMNKETYLCISRPKSIFT